jgi:Rrf2 family transcriptional regulator, cysteine metabolism repressor
MKLSKKSEYGLRALLELTLANGRETLQRHQIAERQHIPVEFLEQILLTLGQVIRILDGPLAPISCVSKTAYQKCSDCPYATKPYCPLQDAMGEVRNAIADILDNYTLDDFASVPRKG